MGSSADSVIGICRIGHCCKENKICSDFSLIFLGCYVLNTLHLLSVNSLSIFFSCGAHRNSISINWSKLCAMMEKINLYVFVFPKPFWSYLYYSEHICPSMFNITIKLNLFFFLPGTLVIYLSLFIFVILYSPSKLTCQNP